MLCFVSLWAATYTALFCIIFAPAHSSLSLGLDNLAFTLKFYVRLEPLLFALISPPLHDTCLTLLFVCFLAGGELGKGTSNSPLCLVWCLAHGRHSVNSLSWNEFPQRNSVSQFRPIKISSKCAMDHSLEIAGMEELVPEETKNTGLDQVMEGSVL